MSDEASAELATTSSSPTAPINRVGSGIESMQSEARSLETQIEQQKTEVEESGDAYDHLAQAITTNKLLVEASFSVVQGSETDQLANCMARIALALGTTHNLFNILILKEFERSSGESILRGNSLSTKIMDCYIKQVGHDYLQNLLADRVNKLLEDEDLNLEVDPNKIECSDETQKQEIIRQHFVTLRDLSQEFIDILTQDKVAKEMPPELVQIATIIGDLALVYEWNKLPLIGSFVILRLFNPAIVFPDLKGLTTRKISNTQRRNLILLTKVIQNLSNGVDFGYKEEYMSVLNPLIEMNQNKMNRFLGSLSPADDSNTLEQKEAKERQIQAAIQDAIARKEISTNLHSEILRVHEILSKHEDEFVETINASCSDENAEVPFKSLMARLPPLMLKRRARSIRPSEIKNSPQEEFQKVMDEQEEQQGEQAPPEPPVPAEEKYRALLNEAKRQDLSDIEKRHIVQIHGLDKQQQRIILFLEGRLPTGGSKSDMDRVLLYIIRTMDPIVESPYCVIYIMNNLSNVKRPSFSWIREIYSTMTRKYKKNMKAIYFVHPTFWIKLTYRLLRPFIKTKFYRKLHYLESVSQIFEYVDRDQIRLPADILQYDLLMKKGNSTQDIRSTAVFGVPIDEAMNRNGVEGILPDVLTSSLAFLESSALESEGLFRIPGNMATIHKYKIFFDNGDYVDVSGADYHSIAGLVKLYLRELPQPIIPVTMYSAFLDILKNEDEAVQNDTSVAIQSLQKLLEQLPFNNRAILSRLCRTLWLTGKHSEKNKMPPSNLAIVFGPTIMRSEDESPLTMMQDIQQINKIVTILITEYETIFATQTSKVF